MTPQVATAAKLESELDRLDDLQTRAQRQFWAAVVFGVAIAALILAVGYSLYHGQRQDKIIQEITVQSESCRNAPDSEACRLTRIGAISVISQAEACYILAQGGIPCASRPLRRTKRLRDALFNPPRQEDQAGTVTPPGGSDIIPGSVAP